MAPKVFTEGSYKSWSRSCTKALHPVCLVTDLGPSMGTEQLGDDVSASRSVDWGMCAQRGPKRLIAGDCHIGEGKTLLGPRAVWHSPCSCLHLGAVGAPKLHSCKLPHLVHMLWTVHCCLVERAVCLDLYALHVDTVLLAFHCWCCICRLCCSSCGAALSEPAAEKDQQQQSACSNHANNDADEFGLI